MIHKIVAFLVTLILNIAIGVAVFFFLLLSMNGYSESDATYGIVAYIALGLIVSLLMSAAAVILVNIFQKRQFSGVVSSLISIVVFACTGAVLKVVCALIGVGLAELVRVKF